MKSETIVFPYKYNLILFFLNIYVIMTSNDFLYISFLDLNYFILKLYLYIKTFIITYDNSHDVYFDFINKSKKNKIIQQLLTYSIYDYGLTTVIAVITYDYSMIFHHITTMILFSLIKKTTLHHISLLSLLLFNISPPILLIAKFLHKYNYKILSIVIFIIFIIVFLTCRILYTSFILYKTINSKDKIKYYYTGHSLFIGLYLLQIYWMYKILSILIKETS
jgi:hypothetical protein